MSDNSQSEIDSLADRLMAMVFAPVGDAPRLPLKGFVLRGGVYSITLRFPPSLNICVGRTSSENKAASYADAARFHFAPWLRKNKTPLAHYNFGPKIAAEFISRNPDVLALLQAIEAQLVRQGTITARVVKEAGVNAKMSDTILAGLAEKIVALEFRIRELEKAAPNNKPATEQPVITTFSPPGSMAHKPKNFVHHESINPAIAKSVFGV